LQVHIATVAAGLARARPRGCRAGSGSRDARDRIRGPHRGNAAPPVAPGPPAAAGAGRPGAGHRHDARPPRDLTL